MATKEEVQQFLQDFKAKLAIWGIAFRDQRGKNAQALLNLEMTPNARRMYLEKLDLADYCEGPLMEVLYGGADMWIFGINIKCQEIYIKITLGLHGNHVICISFHEAEYPMHYPYK